MSEDPVTLSDTQRPAVPALTAEWRLVVVTPSGYVNHLAADSEDDANEQARMFRHSTWTIERRMVGPWVQMGPARRAVTFVQTIEDGSGRPGEEGA